MEAQSEHELFIESTRSDVDGERFFAKSPCALWTGLGARIATIVSGPWESARATRIHPRVVVANPLPDALSHYVEELNSILSEAGVRDISIDRGMSIESRTGWQKPLIALMMIASRRFKRASASLIIVAWPAFGYFDLITWSRVARRTNVLAIVHDVTPLKAAFGHSPRAHSSFRRAALMGTMQIVCHTREAAEELENLTGIRAAVASHPVLENQIAASRGPRQTIRVLGQFKLTRTLDPLTIIAASEVRQDYLLEVHGRGWPDIQGWHVKSRFVPEGEFENLIATSSCVVLPYDMFFQSGVAVRCIESLVPLVGVAHPQLVDLYGEDWPGFVIEGDWAGAIRRVEEVSVDDLIALRGAARARALAEWTELLSQVRPPRKLQGRRQLEGE